MDEREVAITSRHGSDGQVLVTLAGEADLASAPLLERELAWAIGVGTTDVVVDLWDADLLDAASLCRLIEAARLLAQDERELVLLCDPERHPALRLPVVQRGLELTANATNGARFRWDSVPACCSSPSARSSLWPRRSHSATTPA